MRKILLFITLLTYNICFAQTQLSIVKTRGRMINGKHIPGKGLPGTVVSIEGRTTIGVKNNNGTFSFPVKGKQFLVQSVKKNGYTLVDADAAPKTYMHSANVLYLVMETPEQVTQDKLTSERSIRRTLQRQLQKREDEIEALKAANKISQQEYQKALQKLYADQENNEKLISDMAKRYSELDYDQMDDFYRQVNNYIEHGELTRADSILKTRGDVGSQIETELRKGAAIQKEKEELQKAEAVHKHDIEELANRCYSYFEKFKMQHQNDSAAKYIEWRTQLDSTNIDWLKESGTFLQDYVGNYEKATKYFKCALKYSLKINDSTHIAKSYNDLGFAYYNHGQYDKAMYLYNKALLFINKEHADLVTINDNIGCIYYQRGEYNNALSFLSRALEIQKGIDSFNNLKSADLYGNIAVVYNGMDSIDRAMEYQFMALNIRKRILGEEHIDLAVSYSNIGVLYYNLNKFNKALDYSLKALNIRKKILSSNHPLIALSYHNISSLYMETKEYVKALEFTKKALSIRERTLYSLSTDIANSLNTLGAIYVKLENFNDALINYQKALDIRIKSLGNEHLDVATSYNNIAFVHFKNREYEKALSYLHMALSIKEKKLSKDSPSFINTQQAIDMIQKDLNKKNNKP